MIFGIIGFIGLGIWMTSVEVRLHLMEKCDNGLIECLRIVHEKVFKNK